MGKSGFLTPKAIANRIKSKGLQKLRWYCQMCQKQCRDENGFKCHLSSESHQRQLLLFAEDPDMYIDTFSTEYKDGYLELLRRRFGTKRVNANLVYQEYIHDKDHVHMNSTQWETLTDFVKWLGREGLAKVDETEKGWFVQYIDRDPEAIKRQEAAAAKEKMKMDDEEKTAKFIEQQVEKAQREGKETPASEFTELQRENEEEKVTFNLGGSKKSDKEKPSTSGFKVPSNPLKMKKKSESESSNNPSKTSTSGAQKRKSALDEIMEIEEKNKEKQKRKEYWLHEGIVVKIVAKKIGEKYYKRKGVVKEVKDLYTGIVKMLDSGDTIKVDQTHVETVIPAIGKSVLVVNGAYRGTETILTDINERKFSCSVKIKSGPLNGRVLDGLPYEDICKLH